MTGVFHFIAISFSLVVVNPKINVDNMRCQLGAADPMSGPVVAVAYAAFVQDMVDPSGHPSEWLD